VGQSGGSSGVRGLQRGPRSLSRRNSLARGSRLVDRLIAAADSRRLWSHRRAVGLCLFCYSSFADPFSFYLGRHHFWRGGSPHWSRVWERRVRGVARSVHLKHTHTQGGEVKGESEKTKTAQACRRIAQNSHPVPPPHQWPRPPSCPTSPPRRARSRPGTPCPFAPACWPGQRRGRMTVI